MFINVLMVSLFCNYVFIAIRESFLVTIKTLPQHLFDLSCVPSHDKNTFIISNDSQPGNPVLFGIRFRIFQNLAAAAYVQE